MGDGSGSPILEFREGVVTSRRRGFV